MKRIHILKSIALTVFLIFSLSVCAQKGKPHRARHPHHHHGNKVIVKRSVYRPKKVVVFHPVWRPNYSYHRRWIYFPRYNFYWDNWRNHYVYLHNGIWLSQPTAPPILVNINLEKEKQQELKEDEDDIDDVYKNNESHKKEIKPN